jgi:glycosyltransferase involved in cell wall biosynthesis
VLPFVHEAPKKALPALKEAVTVLIPTVDRYSYLRVVLNQLRGQTCPAGEIIVVDQTPGERRESTLAEDFSDLPLRLLTVDPPGQCRSRNAGLQTSTGKYILFLDDDDEIPPTLIQQHLETLRNWECDASCGVADEVGAGPLPAEFRYARVSDVFPTNNTMVRRSSLVKSGLFDLAYDRGQRADGDLGMRLHLSGALMMLNPEIRVLHHHAPRGGLRTHNARVVTFASSRLRLTHRQLGSATEFYLARRYFNEREARELMWQSLLGTYSIRGGIVRKALKVLCSSFLLPHSIWVLLRNRRTASRMLKTYPQIPHLERGD